jgi:catechol 2,3-dioxygenase-like lactoylglutathione lyase family enzyme
MKKLISLFLLCVICAAAEDLPLLGLAHVAIRSSDIEKTRAFYKGALGFEESFDFKAPDGGLAMAFFKINDKQFIEVFPGVRAADEGKPLLVHVGFIVADVDKAYKICEQLGMKPAPVKLGERDHDRHFVIWNPPGQKLTFLEFMQYQPGSVYRENEGKALGARRISTHLEHAGIVTTDLPAAQSFYAKLGFKETWRRNDDAGKPMLIHLRLPGPTTDYVELSVRQPDAKMTRKQLGTAGHFSLEVPDIKSALSEAQGRGIKTDDPKFGRDERWQFNMFDPDSTRAECMQPRAKK